MRTQQPIAATTPKEPPGPRGHRLFGSLYDMRRDPIRLFMGAWRDHGDVVRFWMGPKTVFLVAHPDHVKHVLQDYHKNYDKQTRGWQILRTFLGQGLLTSEGDYWLRHRRIAQPSFHRARVASFGARMVEATAAMLARWETHADGQPLDVAAEMMQLTMGIVSETLLSANVEAEARVVGRALPVVLHHANDHITSLFILPESFPTKQNRRFREAVRALDEVVFGIIAQRRQRGEDAGDLLSMLMAARDEETGEGMNDRELRDEVMTIFLAGHETTANVLTWTWCLLSSHPAVARALRDELAHVLGGRSPTADDLPRLPYAAAVIHEALRLYPPAWMLARSVVADDTLDSYRIPAGAFVLTSPYVTHRHPAFWENPEGFDPDRFLGHKAADLHRFAYFPFGAGPRQCIGNAFALMEAQLVLATVASRVRLDLAPGHPVEPEPLITLRPRHGMMMTMHRV